MIAFLRGLQRTAGIALLILLVCAAFAVASGAVKVPWLAATAENSAPAPKEGLAVDLVEGQPNSLIVPEGVRKSLGIRKGHNDQVAVVTTPTRTRPLERIPKTSSAPCGG